MKPTILFVAAVMMIGLVGCTSADCGRPVYQSPCQTAPAAPMAAKNTDFLGNECGKPVYEGPHCIEIPQSVKDFFAGIHEAIFDCQPDPVLYRAAPPACPPPAAANPCD